MWAMAFTLTLRVPQGDPTLNICNKINFPNTCGIQTIKAWPPINSSL